MSIPSRVFLVTMCLVAVVTLLAMVYLPDSQRHDTTWSENGVLQDKLIDFSQRVSDFHEFVTPRQIQSPSSKQKRIKDVPRGIQNQSSNKPKELADSSNKHKKMKDSHQVAPRRIENSSDLRDKPSKPTQKYENNSWVASLKELVKVVNADNQVSFLFSTLSYLNSTLNWLIAARVRCELPVTNTIVICYDQATLNVLKERDIPSLYIDPNTLFHSEHAIDDDYGNFISARRLVVLMLVNSWGYDVVQYDSDAIIVKNPRELFAQHPHSDMVVSGATGYPGNILEKWGFVVCMGVVLYRSSPKIGKFYRQKGRQ